MVARHRPANELELKVRGRPFKPGNPGRPPGSKNKTTRLVEQLVDNEAEKLTRKLIDLALAGDVRCLQYCLDRLLSRRSGRALDIQLPTINNVHDIVPAMATITTAVSSGDLTAEEAADLIRWVEAYGKIFTIYDVAIRLDVLEKQMKEKGLDLTPSQRTTKFGMSRTP